MRGIVVAANWKLNKGPSESIEFLDSFLKKLSTEEESYFLFFTAAYNLPVFSEKLSSTKIRFGSQNMYPSNKGAFTGELSPAVLKELSAQVVLIGHSERRQFFSETDNFIAQKLAFAQAEGLTPVFCLGETLKERESGETNEVILGQLKSGLSKTNLSKPIIIAYEPVWAIGTGKVATPEMAEEAHRTLRGGLKELCGERADSISILYGGSVKPDSARELFAQDNIDGFLVGGASLEPESFYQILVKAQCQT